MRINCYLPTANCTNSNINCSHNAGLLQIVPNPIGVVKKCLDRGCPQSEFPNALIPDVKVCHGNVPSTLRGGPATGKIGDMQHPYWASHWVRCPGARHRMGEMKQ